MECCKRKLQGHRPARGCAEIFRRRSCAARTSTSGDRPERDRRPDRRQWRRQVDADQGDDRRAEADFRQASTSATGRSTSPTIRSAWRTSSRSRPSTRTSRSARSSRCGATSSSAGRSPTAWASSTSSARRRSPRTSCSGHRLPRRRHHRRIHGQQAFGRRASGHRDRPGHALQGRPHRARRADGGAGGEGGAQGAGFRRRIKARGRACIYIEHNLAHVHEVADRLVVLDRGEIVTEIAPQT